MNPTRIIETQNKLKELKSEQTMRIIEFMLKNQNRDVLDKATIQLFEAFRHKDFTVDGEAAPISEC